MRWRSIFCNFSRVSSVSPAMVPGYTDPASFHLALLTRKEAGLSIISRCFFSRPSAIARIKISLCFGAGPFPGANVECFCLSIYYRSHPWRSACPIFFLLLCHSCRYFYVLDLEIQNITPKPFEAWLRFPNELFNSSRDNICPLWRSAITNHPACGCLYNRGQSQ